jgi:hypothetical protein
MSVDPNFEAAAFVLRSPFLARKGAAQWVLPDWTIDVAGLTDVMKPWSHTEKMMVNLALDLYEVSDHGQSIDDMICYLDEPNWTVFMDAINLKRDLLRGQL